MKHFKKIAMLFIAAITLQACYPGDSIPIEDLDTASTFYVPEDFSPAPATVAILWDVARIEGSDPDNDLDYEGEVDDEILNTTLENLVKIYGEGNITIISETATPNPAPSNSNIAIVTPTDPIPSVDGAYAPSIKLTRETVGIVYPGYPWYGGGWGCWYCSPCYYCGYPPTVSYQSYDVGSVVIDLIDVRQLTPGETPGEFTPSWVGLFRGLVSSNSTSNSARVVSNINQAFEQSPYLKN